MNALLVALSLAAAPAPASPWRALEPGLEEGAFALPASEFGDRTLHVLRVDPARLDLVLLSAGREQPMRSAKAWVTSHDGVAAAINAGMFEKDYKTATGMMVTPGYVNNPTLKPTYRAILLWDPKEGGLPPVQIVDGQGEAYRKLKEKYGSQVQGLRMTDEAGHNTWGASTRRWSTACVGVDTSGHVLFMVARSPYAVKDLALAMEAMPLHLTTTLYVEGGPEATVYARGPGGEREWFGSYETGFVSDDSNDHEWELPNVLAVKRRAALQGKPDAGL
jgi:uncharacterized protein YigE (DUF2233 family)